METEDTLRVVRITTSGARTNREIIWSGSSIDDLSRAYPPSDVMGADPLERDEVDDGLVVITYEFEQRMTGRDDWSKINDPRRRLTPVTATERAIDKENRRFFPGDYIDTDGCEHCGDPDCDGDCYTNPRMEFDEEDLRV